MKTLEQKIIDFKTKFTRGGWLDEEKNFCEIEIWLKENFLSEPEDPVFKSLEELKVDSGVKLPKVDENAPVDVVELPTAPIEVGSDVELPVMPAEIGSDVEIKEEAKVEVVGEEINPTPIVEKKEGFLDKILK